MTEKYTIKDSGERKEFQTGAVRDIARDKGRFDLLQMFGIISQAIHMEKGCDKYGYRNWEKGIPISKYVDSGLRHVIKFILGLEDEKHLEAAIWNFMRLKDSLIRIQLDLLPGELNDLPYPLKGVDEDKLKEIFNNWI